MELPPPRSPRTDTHFPYPTLCRSVLNGTDVLFVGAFTRSAQTAYAVSNLSRRGGAVTVLGGPHARCYPQDAAKYFDYVLGFTDKRVIADLLSDVAPHRPLGVQLGAARQPTEMPSLNDDLQMRSDGLIPIC